jgi:hypothetical protein
MGACSFIRVIRGLIVSAPTNGRDTSDESEALVLMTRRRQGNHKSHESHEWRNRERTIRVCSIVRSSQARELIRCRLAFRVRPRLVCGSRLGVAHSGSATPFTRIRENLGLVRPIVPIIRADFAPYSPYPSQLLRISRIFLTIRLTSCRYGRYWFRKDERNGEARQARCLPAGPVRRETETAPWKELHHVGTHQEAHQ